MNATSKMKVKLLSNVTGSILLDKDHCYGILLSLNNSFNNGHFIFIILLLTQALLSIYLFNLLPMIFICK